MFGCCCSNNWITLMVRSCRSCEPHQANRSSILSPDEAAAGAVVAAGLAAALVGAPPPAGCVAAGLLHAARTSGTLTRAVNQPGRAADARFEDCIRHTSHECSTLHMIRVLPGARGASPASDSTMPRRVSPAPVEPRVGRLQC